MVELYDKSNQVIEGQLTERLTQIEEVTAQDVLVFRGAIHYGADELIRDSVEALNSDCEKLTVILETNGGYIEVARRIVDVIRKHYQHIEFIVPDYAMSAGTVLVLSGDVIHMDYFSVLGPIDPQVERSGPEKKFVPALGYLEWYDRLMKKSQTNQLTDAELSFLLAKFDPAELYQFEQERELSITLLREWLAKYKFKDWNCTETNKTPVTQQMREDRAQEIATSLNDTGMWHTHGRGIPMVVLRKKLNLKIEDFGENESLKSAIRSYYRLLTDYMNVMSLNYVIHTRDHFESVRGA